MLCTFSSRHELKWSLPPSQAEIDVDLFLTNYFNMDKSLFVCRVRMNVCLIRLNHKFMMNVVNDTSTRMCRWNLWSFFFSYVDTRLGHRFHFICHVAIVVAVCNIIFVVVFINVFRSYFNHDFKTKCFESKSFAFSTNLTVWKLWSKKTPLVNTICDFLAF